MQKKAQWVFSSAVLLLALWIIRDFLPALAWAGIIGLASWPLYQKFCTYVPNRNRAALLFTALVSLVFLAPLAYFLLMIGYEAKVIAAVLIEAQKNGIPPPDWMEKIPFAGPAALAWWKEVLGDPGGFSEWFHRFDQKPILDFVKNFSLGILHRMLIFAITILSLFFIYRDGKFLASKILAISHELLDERGKVHALRIADTVRSTVNGLVIVAFAEGLLLGIGYAFAGLPSPSIWGAATGVLSIIPFAMPVVFSVACLILLAQGSATAALLVFIWGFLVMLIADHVVRPLLIGGSASIPLVWILVGILGGAQSLGILGLFLGPVIVATAISIWREWAND